MNSHRENAMKLFTATATTVSVAESAEMAARAQVQAILALVYEQRTANLIMMTSSHRIIPGVDYAAINEEIKRRMGLSDPTT